MRIFLKNCQCQISLIVIGNQKFQKVSKFSSIMANNCNNNCFQKLYSIFQLFHVEWKTKCYESLRYSSSPKNLRKAQGLLHKLDFIFQWKMGCMKESENMAYLWHYATDFLQFCTYYVTMCLGKNGLLNKN